MSKHLVTTNGPDSGLTQTPQMRARDSLYKRYNARGRKRSNLWLVYSPKIDRDVILDSDMHFIYWLHFLESDPKVESFLMVDKDRKTDPNALVIFRGGERRADYLGAPSDMTQSVVFIDHGNEKWHTRYIDEEEILNVSKVAQRWLKPIMFAAAIRGSSLLPLHNALVAATLQCQSGTIRYLLTQLSGHDPTQALGMIMRHFVQGRILLDLSNNSFGYNTTWTAISGDHNAQ